MGGELKVQDGSCENCNVSFSSAEAKIKTATTTLLNLLQIENRDGIVPNAPLENVEIRGMDMKNLNGFMNGGGEINLSSVVRESKTADGKRFRQGFFLTKEAGDKFATRAAAKGAQVIERDTPERIVIEADYVVTLPFIGSLETRKVVAKIALTAIALEYGVPFSLSTDFDALRNFCIAKGTPKPRVWFFANQGIMTAQTRTVHQHSVMCYMSAGMQKGWVLVTLFEGFFIWWKLRLNIRHPKANNSASSMTHLPRSVFRP